ncbi:peptidoglycan editing factor PgeF [Paenibacillus sp. CAA11]|uniref:peptidoglycan editing factor PgeF n=1 Tax=Paenibacillus sp. CAA11 TaxID=1532905 RepID=UPI000D33A19D|nr:peptidoglycan editing factor PgeF [Paenibacillus sp. CAA11]AWB45355.1 peptidoglycan editing factor PgeF [Paenibacillus sp. CAA11]
MEPFVRRSYDHIEKEKAVELFELEGWNAENGWLSAGFTGRHGGGSKVPYESFNLALHVGDHPEDVLENRVLLEQELGFEPGAWTCGEQTHGTQIAIVTDEDRGKGRMDRESAFQQTDGLVTNVPGILLTSFYADCVPLYFLDPVHRVVGLAHAGWKGTVGEIAAKMIAVMEQAYGSRREEIRTAIGPSIGSCCYEVDEAVITRVRPVLDQAGLQEIAAEPVFRESQNQGRKMLNLKELNRIIMIKAGILPTHIECTTWCTSCHNTHFFSYRKENGVTGRMASWIGMKER